MTVALPSAHGADRSVREATYFGTPLMWSANGWLVDVGQWSAHSW